ncbi:hypothetical protein E2C01_005775 [Portunus trituberculatus]|uniref:Uncharacterized protein n=1 Tax=Portunus trituberculatus TaxID=210409 RepID=A0A5B7CWC6_PORTR|nr:hypothetical protein [Portunus trituberculatus]
MATTNPALEFPSGGGNHKCPQASPHQESLFGKFANRFQTMFLVQTSVVVMIVVSVEVEEKKKMGEEKEPFMLMALIKGSSFTSLAKNLPVCRDIFLGVPEPGFLAGTAPRRRFSAAVFSLSLGAPVDELKGVYLTFILPKLMYAVPAWSSSLNLTQRQQLERVQKRAFRVILGPAYRFYKDALTCLSLPRLAIRHQEALEKFGEGLLHHPRLHHLLPSDVPPPAHATRHQNRVASLRAPRTDQYHLSAVPTMDRQQTLL